MKFVSKKSVNIAVILLVACVSANAQSELTSVEQKVLADYELMKGMSAQERRDYRKVIWDNPDKKTQRAYNRAYKNLMETRVIANLPKDPQATAQKPKAQKIPGTSITYHSGALTPATTSSVSVGNRFNSALNPSGTAIAPLEASGSITMATINMAGVGGGSAFISIYDQISGTEANQITSMVFPMGAGANTITFASPLNYVGGEFLGGVWNFTAGTDSVNVATGTVGGQGFHGMSINDGNPGNGFTEFTMTNGAVGFSGNLTTPVELMNFEID